MTNTNRRTVLRAGLACVAFPGTMMHWGHARNHNDALHVSNGSPNDFADEVAQNTKGNSMKIQYLEIVTSDVDAVCKTYAQLHNVEFGEKDQNLGGARTAKLATGGMLGIRAPMHAAEKPVVRPYILVEDIKATVDAAAESGAEIAVPPMELPGHGMCAIVIQGGIESGFWQQ